MLFLHTLRFAVWPIFPRFFIFWHSLDILTFCSGVSRLNKTPFGHDWRITGYKATYPCLSMFNWEAVMTPTIFPWTMLMLILDAFMSHLSVLNILVKVWWPLLSYKSRRIERTECAQYCGRSKVSPNYVPMCSSDSRLEDSLKVHLPWRLLQKRSRKQSILKQL